MITLIASIFVFSLVILVHEFGHFKAAKSVGIKVDEFAIGMGPVIYKKEKNGTLYSVRLLPIGGFVRMEGEEEDVNSSTSYSSKTVWQRFKVIASGPIMNFLLAVVIYIIMAAFFGVTGSTLDVVLEESEMYKAGVREDDKIISVNDKKVYIRDEIVYEITQDPEKPYEVTVKRNDEILTFNVNQYYRNIIGITAVDVASTVINVADDKSPAYSVGIRSGDKVVKINDTAVNNFEELRTVINMTNGESVKITVDRNGEILEYNATPKKELDLGFDTKVEKSIMTTIVSSVYKTGYYISMMFEFIGMLLTGQVGSEAVGGPVQVISMIGESAKLGIYPLLNLLAFISVNLGFMNLLPIPALDGSKLVFLIIEKIRGKKIPVEKEGFVNFIGFVLLMSLMVFVTYKDIVRLFQ